MMEVDKVAELARTEAHQWRKNIEKKYTGNLKEQDKVLEFYKESEKYLKEYGITTVIVLQSIRAFDSIFQCVENNLKNDHNKKYEIMHVIATLETNFSYFFQEQSQLKKSFLKIMNHSDYQKILSENKNLSYSYKNNSSYKQDDMIKLVKEYLIIENQKENYERRRKINSFIQEKLKRYDSEIPLEQIAINYISIRIEKLQNQSEQLLCCRVHFELNKGVHLIEDQTHQFKKYYWPLQKLNLIQHLQKTVIGFLNTTGGIIYIGLEEDAVKHVKVIGIGLTKAEKIQFLKFIYEKVVNVIYPDVEEKILKNQEKTQKLSEYIKLFERKKSLVENGDYEINKYVSVDFLDVYESDTLLNARDKDIKRDLYIVRLKIKLGNPYELYHLINDKEIPQTFMREDKMVKKKNINQFMDLLQARLKKKMEKMPDKPKQYFHDNCRFSLKVKEKEDQIKK